MKLRRTLTAVGVAGVLTATGVGAVAIGAPVVAMAATGDTAGAVERLAGIKDALEGLVSDGTITQDQADKVAETLNESDALKGPHGGPGRGGGLGGPLALDTAAEALGLTAEELRTQLEAGKSLADVAEAEGVETSALIDAVVAESTARIKERLAAGDLSAAQAEELTDTLQERVTDLIERSGLGGGGGRGHGPGGHGHGGRGEAPSTPAPDTTPSAPGTSPSPPTTPSPSPTTESSVFA